MHTHDIVAILDAVGRLGPTIGILITGIPGLVSAWMVWRNSKKVDSVVQKVSDVEGKLEVNTAITHEVKRQTDGLLETTRSEAFKQGVQAASEDNIIGFPEKKQGLQLEKPVDNTTPDVQQKVGE